MKIITDGKWKPFKYRYEVPKKIIESQFDYQEEEDGWDAQLDGYFEYKGYWYHLDNFCVIDKNSPLEKEGWEGVYPDSAFTGVLLKVSKNNEYYMVGRYVC